MPPAPRRIRAHFDDESILVYQAFNEDIADAAVLHGRLGKPFSFERMTWIKPSFLWMMERCGYGTVEDQERVLAIRITMEGWQEALRNASLTFAGPSEAPVRVQWDPDRDLHGNKLTNRTIQVGLGPAIVRRYVDDWTMDITDISEYVAELRAKREQGKFTQALAMLPQERVWQPPSDIAERLDMLTRV